MLAVQTDGDVQMLSCGREFRDTRKINSFLPAFTCTGSYNRNHKRACRFRIYVQSSLQAVYFYIIFFFKNILDQRKAYCGQKCKKGIILYYQQNKDKQPGIEKSKMKRPITVGQDQILKSLGFMVDLITNHFSLLN